jgi:hypothetical protein
MVCHSYLALLPDQGVAGWPWNQWPDERGTGGRISVESVAEWAWNTQYCHSLGFVARLARLVSFMFYQTARALGY